MTHPAHSAHAARPMVPEQVFRNWERLRLSRLRLRMKVEHLRAVMRVT